MLYIVHPLVTDHILEKVLLKAFRKIFRKILSLVHILRFLITNCLKRSMELHHVIQISDQKNYIPELYPPVLLI